MDSLNHEAQLRALIDSVRIGLLCTTSPEGYPRSRWMVATTLPGVRGSLYSVCFSGSGKTDDLAFSDKVSWAFQTVALDHIAQVRGRAALIDNPELKAQVVEALGPALAHFWRVHTNPGRLLVLETRIESVRMAHPLQPGRDRGTEPEGAML